MKRFKKFLFVSLFVISSLLFCSCDSLGQNGDRQSYTVTFEQNGVKDIVKTVKAGETLDDIPLPKDKVGYTIVWDTNDFSSITQDMTVKAIETPNKYTISFDENSGNALFSDTITVEYDATYVLPQPTHAEGFLFKGWQVGNELLKNSGIWRIDGQESITATAVWQCSITFQQEGLTDRVFYVNYGESFMDIPQIENVPLGVDCRWNISDFSSVTENMTVSVIYEAKQFSVCLDLNDGSGKTQTITVKYGENYSLNAPQRKGYTFDCWTYNGEEISSSGIWLFGGENITLKAKWTNNADVGDWTPSF